MGKQKSKINRIRSFALYLVFIGILIMYLGLLFKENHLVMAIVMLLGFFAVLASAGIYFMVGMLSLKAVRVICPSCEKQTKMLGRVDICMYCNEPLTLDKELEGLEFDPSYNRKSK